MTRRASLPGASELFRSTSGSATSNPALQQANGSVPRQSSKPSEETVSTGGTSSGRQKHDSKITVYLSAEELLAMEQARLTLRGAHELPVDRGRIVREAVAVLLDDFDQHGAESVLVRRLRGQESRAESTEN